MTASWQTVRTGSVATGEVEAERTEGASDAEGRGGAEWTGEHEDWVPAGLGPEDAEALPAIPRAFADGDARRALLRDLVLRALI
jgi:hypothetical protein